MTASAGASRHRVAVCPVAGGQFGGQSLGLFCDRRIGARSDRCGLALDSLELLSDLLAGALHPVAEDHDVDADGEVANAEIEVVLHLIG